MKEYPEFRKSNIFFQKIVKLLNYNLKKGVNEWLQKQLWKNRSMISIL